MAQRISRAKQRIRRAGARFAHAAAADERPERLRAVLHVLYLIFNEGYTASAGPDLHRGRADRRGDPAHPARRARCCPTTARSPGCSRSCCSPTPGARPAPTPTGSSSRSPSRTAAGGTGELIGEGVALDHRRAARGTARAVPAAGGDRRRARRGARRAATPTGRRSSRSTGCSSGSRPTRWSRSTTPSPSAMVDGPAAGLAVLAAAGRRRPAGRHHRLHAVRAHLLEMAGDRAGALATATAAPPG